LASLETQNNNTSGDQPSEQQNWQLVAEGDWLVGQRFPVNSHSVLGRDSSCDITIPGTHLSRRHAELAVKGNKLLIRDLNSSNGTYVNDQRITETELKPGDTIRFDVLLFRIEGPKNNEPDINATIIRQMPKQARKVTPAKPPEPRNFKTKPTSVGNREDTVQMTSVQKATRSLSTILALGIAVAILAALAYMVTQL
jgi:predicted component of type VI protein secretion system